ncbi:hypothetical protein OESDEN_13657 [Oesophagostomum dentatum]|uniref:Uncharacterized protein n=1 Tax=Oesophagostomum dentatum TaxID=61180 RepID=A0A0B1SRS1_OESDE|nr:hypothetical protein OESDEN_13657 [Oesophagostomum dentatum]
MFFLPMVMQQGSISNLRSTIKSMTSVRGRPVYRGKLDKPKEYSTHWTPAKEMEHELTRNKMKRLMRKRKKRKTLLLNPDAALSPEALSSPSANSPLLASTPVRVYEPDPNLTDKCLKVLFFEPAESVEEIKMLRSRMTMPPSNMEELMKIQEELASSAKTECQV